MGYTHYWHKKLVLSPKKFNQFSEVVEKLLSTDEAKRILAYENDIPKPPKVTNQFIRFNGIGEDGHETFLFERKAELRDYEKTQAVLKVAFNFCKTARKPYDKYVTACLIIAKSIFGKDVRVSSDGELGDWQEGKEMVEKFMNSKVAISQGEEGNFEVEVKINQTTEEEFIKDITK